MVKHVISRCIACLTAILLLINITGCSPRSEISQADHTENVKNLEMWKFRSNKEDYVISRWVKQWNEENPGIQVNFEVIPYNDYLTNRLPTAFATNSAPDIYMISAGSFLKYAKAGYMLPLDDFISDGLRRDLNPQSLEIATYNKKVLGIPIEREPVALYYNKKVFERQHLKPPTTWSELESCAKTVQSDDISGICLPTQINDYQNFIFYTFLMQTTGSTDSYMAATQFGTKGAKALSLWRNLAKYNYTQETSVQIPSDIYPFATEKSAMQICGFWAVRMLEKYYPDLEYGIVPVPHPDGGSSASVYGGWYQAVNSNSRFAQDAVKFTLWMWGEDTSRPLEWCTEASSKVPARKSVIDNNRDIFYKGKNTFFMQEVMSRSIPEPRYPVEISSTISKALQDAMYSDKKIDDIAKFAEDQIHGYIGGESQIF